MDTVMIVDDEPAIREIFSAYLMMAGYSILTAPGGIECMEMLKTEKPDLILLDMMMEPMDGWETLLAIRACTTCSHIPVIIITGKSPVPEEILKYGVSIEDYILKPVDFKQIAGSLHRIIEKDRDLKREIDRIKNEQQDPEFLYEYTCLLRLFRVAHNLLKRLKDPLWADQPLMKKQEERLYMLHKKMGIPDRFLTIDERG